MSQTQRLVRELATTNVLSVYLDTRVTDPAMRDAWRPALTTALRAASETVPRREREEFERAADALAAAVLPLGGTWGAPGWMAFVTAAGVHFMSALPMRCETMVAWRRGPVVAPYMRVLKQHRPVIVALVDSRSARLFHYAWGELTTLADMTLSADELAPARAARGAEPRARAYPSPRGATGTEQPERRRLAAFQRLASSLGARLAELAGEDGWILIGGTPTWSRLAASSLPAHLAGRVLVSTTLDHGAPDDSIAGAARRAASTLRSARGRELLDALLERAGGRGRAASGVPATQRALRARAVDLLVLSAEFLRTDSAAEEVVRAALRHGADVEILSAEAAERLDEAADGIAARLRFAPDAPLPLRRTPTGARFAAPGSDTPPAA